MSNVVNAPTQPGVTTTTSEGAPIHYVVKIQHFSLLAKNAVEKYESGVFEAGGYKWKLVLHPNGNKSKNVKDHISLYLAMADTTSLPLGWEVYAIFRLFMLDQNKDNYLIIQDGMGKERRFSKLKLEWGFDQFIQLPKFNDANNGYLVEDTCVFGAEVFVRKERSTGRGELLSMINQPTSFKHTWKMENFSKLDAERKESEIFTVGDKKWKMQLYPKGNGFGAGTHLSVYLALTDSASLPPASKLYVDYSLRVLDQVRDRKLDLFGKGKFWFSGASRESGWARYVSLDYLYQPGNALVYKDVCFVEAEVMILGIAGTL